MSKVCTKCKIEKQEADFVKDKYKKSGLTSQCKDCRNAHNKTRHPLYRVYNDMRARCYSPNIANYKRYGARGIGVCAEWLDDKEIFIAWAINNGWESGLDLDRIDNNKDYCPDNCRFVTHKENARNTSRSKWWYVNGVKYESLSHAAHHEGVGLNTIAAWCKGYTVSGVSYPAKENCYSEAKYSE